MSHGFAPSVTIGIQTDSTCSKDGVTENVPREKGAESQSCCPVAAEAMEGLQKKSELASSLLKRVISKKMQLEQEFCMERGEIMNPSQLAKELEEPGEKGQNSCYSETSSDHGTCMSEGLGELFNAKSSPNYDCTWELQQAATGDGHQNAAKETKGVLRRSQNSAFRYWQDRELQKTDRTEPYVVQMKDWRADPIKLSVGHSAEKSCLFMPGIQQHTPKEKQPEKQATKGSTASIYMHQNWYKEAAPLTAQVASHGPNIQFLTRSAPEAKDQHLSINKLLTPNLDPTPSYLTIAAKDRDQVALKVEEKLPKFLIRDVRDSKSKTSGTIHQVRDIRKLIKSAQLPSITETTSKTSTASSVAALEQSKSKLALSNISNSQSPLIVPYHMVKSKEENRGAQGVHGLATSKSQPLDTVLVHRASGQLPVATIAPNKSCPRLPVVKIVSKASAWKLEKPKEKEAKEEPSALERLTAAVQSMEEPYTFKRHEWLHKDEPLPITNSHVLSVQEKEEEVKRAIGARRGTRSLELTWSPVHHNSMLNATEYQQTKAMPGLTLQEEKEAEQPGRTLEKEPTRIGTSTTNSLYIPSSPQKMPGTVSNRIRSSQSPAATIKLPLSQPLPASTAFHPLRPEKSMGSEQSAAKASPPLPSNQSSSTDYGNYLTIPVKGGSGSPPKGQNGGTPERPVSLLATMYQSSPLPLVFSSPVMPTAPQNLLKPAPPQQKVLMDLSTGQCFMLETPKRRLYDPESGQYVAVPILPAPLPISPLMLSPGAYSPAYMLYPSFIPTAAATPLLPASALFSEVPKEKRPYYLPTGNPTNGATATNMARTSSEGKEGRFDPAFWPHPPSTALP